MGARVPSLSDCMGARVASLSDCMGARVASLPSLSASIKMRCGKAGYKARAHFDLCTNEGTLINSLSCNQVGLHSLRPSSDV